MSTRPINTRICASLCISLFCSTAIAQVSAVSDRTSVAGTDIIDWGNYETSGGVYTVIASPADILTNGGAGLTVMQSGGDSSIVLPEPNVFLGDTNMPNGSHLYFTNIADNYQNITSFSDFDGLDACALGTQIAPVEGGSYTARIEAFGANGSLGYFDFTGATSNPEALFAGIESTEVMTRVEISLINTGSGGGQHGSYYSINQVDLRACPSAPEVPVVSCDGFYSPMDNFPVKTRKNRVFPLKMELFDEDGFELTSLDLAAAPTVMVMFAAGGEEDAIDVSGDVLSSGRGSDGNQFEFTDEDIWQFNLKSKNYSAKGTYYVSVVSGDEEEYVIDPACVSSFVK